MKITEQLDLFFGENISEIKTDKKKIERVPAGSPYWVMILNPDNDKEIIPKKRIEQECESLKKEIQELDLTLKKAEAEKQSKENICGALEYWISFCIRSFTSYRSASTANRKR